MLVSPPLPVTRTSFAPILVASDAPQDISDTVLCDPSTIIFTQLAGFVSNRVRVLKRIPKAVRHLASSKLARILDSVVECNDDASWCRLLTLSVRCFMVPKRGGKRCSLASHVNRLVNEEMDSLPLRLIQPARFVSSCVPDPLRSLSKRVSAKLEEGDYRAAVRTACSNDTMAILSPDTISALKQKHPAAHADTTVLSQLSMGEHASLCCLEEEVARAIHSFPNGSAGGPDGLRPQHLKDLVGAAAGNGGRDPLRALTAFVNFILQGHTPLSVRSSFFGATLIALQKMEGGIRPIAVGLTLRRLVAKCASFHVRQFIGDKLAPLQFGFGTQLGCEAAVHAARMYLANCPSNHLLLKLDFSNAFNCLRRDKMLMAVKNSVPELYNFVFSAHGNLLTCFVEITF